MSRDIDYVDGVTVVPANWLNAIQEVLSGIAIGVRMERASSTHLQFVPIDDGDDSIAGQSSMIIDGQMRWWKSIITVTVTGAAATYGVFVIAGETEELTATDIVIAASAPANSRKIGTVTWSGTEITSIEQSGIDGVTGAMITSTALGSSTSMEWERAPGGGMVPKVKAGGIGTNELAASAVTAAKIAAEAVVTAAIQAGAVTTAKIANGAITAALLAAEAVTEAKLGTGAVTAVKLAAEAVTAAKIAASAVTAAKIGSEAVEEAKIKALAVTAGKLAAEAVTMEKLGSDVKAALQAGGSAAAHLWIPGEIGVTSTSPAEFSGGTKLELPVVKPHQMLEVVVRGWLGPVVTGNTAVVQLNIFGVKVASVSKVGSAETTWSRFVTAPAAATAMESGATITKANLETLIAGIESGTGMNYGPQLPAALFFIAPEAEKAPGVVSFQGSSTPSGQVLVRGLHIGIRPWG